MTNVLYVGPVLPEYTAALKGLLGERFTLEVVGRIGPTTCPGSSRPTYSWVSV